MRPTELRRRLAALEKRPAAACADPWHAWAAPRLVDYRHAIRALDPEAADVGTDAPVENACPRCGATRARVAVVGSPFPDYLVEAYAAERIARRLLEPTDDATEEGAPTDDHD